MRALHDVPTFFGSWNCRTSPLLHFSKTPIYYNHDLIWVLTTSKCSLAKYGTFLVSNNTISKYAVNKLF